MNEHIMALGSRLAPQDRKLLAALAKSADEEVTASGVRPGLSDEQNEKLRALAGEDATGFKLCLAESVGRKFVGSVRCAPSGGCIVTVTENESFRNCTALFIFDLVERLRESRECGISSVAIEGADGEVSARFAEMLGEFSPLADGADVLVNGVSVLPEVHAEESAEVTAEETEANTEPENEPEPEASPETDRFEAPSFPVAPVDLTDAVSGETVTGEDTPEENEEGDIFDELFESEPQTDTEGYCPCCGRQIRSSSLFCGYCGTPFIDRLTAAL